jgi:hypothetical protein
MWIFLYRRLWLLKYLLRWVGYPPWSPSTSVTDREASMILFRIVFAVTAILLSRDAFAEPGMWIGTAPFCYGSPADCTDLGMTYVKSDSKGDGGRCWTGTKLHSWVLMLVTVFNVIE